jgi:hypothetical protein
LAVGGRLGPIRKTFSNLWGERRRKEGRKERRKERNKYERV